MEIMGKSLFDRSKAEADTPSESAHNGPLFGGHLRYVLITSFIAIFALIFTMVVILPGTNVFRPALPSASLLSQCTVSLQSGSFWVRDTDTGTWEQGTDGMTLSAGTTIKTDEKSRLLITFFEGSTIALESKTEVKVEVLDRAAAGYRMIRLRQVLGRTWSLVEKMADTRSRFEIQTPSAHALVRGTSFIVNVNEDGSTYIGVIDGLVAVTAQGEETAVKAGYGINISNGMSPSAPVEMEPDMIKEYQRPNQSGNRGNTVIRSVP